MNAHPISLFFLMSLGLSEKKAKETIKNVGLTKKLMFIRKEVVKYGGIPNGMGSLVYYLASKIKSQLQDHLPLLCQYICRQKLDSLNKVDAALSFLVKNMGKNWEICELESECGIGVVVKHEDIVVAVKMAMRKYNSEIYEKRYRFDTGLLMHEVRTILKWADGKDVMHEIDVQMVDILGPRMDDDYYLIVNKQEKKMIREAAKSMKGECKYYPEIFSKRARKIERVFAKFDMMGKVNLYEPGSNSERDDYVITSSIGEQVRTRFSPEPNGILHIGHAKAININFGYAALKNGICFLRFHDTNPEKEEEKFYVGIKDMVEWLGYIPYKVTHSSDYFDQLYVWAIELITKGYAYVCHQKQEEIKVFNSPPSPWRNRPIKESIEIFEFMKNGKMKEGECTLRLKVTLEEGKKDPVAYRIKNVPHHRTGRKWYIYPTDDYTHCLCDSIEHITHSLCTKEFQSRRSFNYWLCNVLDIYCPVQLKYGRLNINDSILSKKRILRLIKHGLLKDIDDPRLHTLPALRRRGFPPESINKYCSSFGFTDAQTSVDPSMLEASVRDTLNSTAPRTMVVLEPLRVVIIHGPKEDRLINVPDYPAHPEKSVHDIQFSEVIFIEKTDFSLESNKNYRRLTPNQTVGLKYASLVLQLDKVNYDSDGYIEDIFVRAFALNKENKPKAFIHWVAWPVSIRVRIYKDLFRFGRTYPESLAENPVRYWHEIRRNSLREYSAMADSSLYRGVWPYTQYQFERLGYFTVDPDTSYQQVVFNRTVSLKEDVRKE